MGADPPAGGYRPGDLIFFGHGDGPSGHVALWLGDRQIVQCSASGKGSNIRPLDGYVAPTSVDDADAAAERAAELGGQVVVPPFDLPWVRMTVIADPQGATFTASQFVPESGSH